MNNILVVDDSVTMRMHLTGVLSRAGYTVRAAGSGRAALASHKTEPADLVILDIIMPEMDGLETFQALRAADAHVKVLGISGMGPRFSSDYLKMLQKLGAEAVMEKPFTEEVFIQTIRRILGSARMSPAEQLA